MRRGTRAGCQAVLARLIQVDTTTFEQFMLCILIYFYILNCVLFSHGFSVKIPFAKPRRIESFQRSVELRAQALGDKLLSLTVSSLAC